MRVAPVFAIHPFRWLSQPMSSAGKRNGRGAFFKSGSDRQPVVLAFGLMCFMCLVSLTRAEEPVNPAPARQKELIRMVRQDCGSCHGLTLRGGLGPALLPDTLRNRPPAGLKYTILLGRPGTAMPPWQPFMTEAEADWIVAQLLRGFPEEVK